MKMNPGNSVFSAGPSVDLTPEDGLMSSVPHMDSHIPSSTPKEGCLSNDFDPYSGMNNYGSMATPPAMDSFETTDGRHTEVPALEDAHPIKPFHEVIRSQGFKPSKSQHTETGRINHYEKENSGGGKESVELHHDRGSGKITSVTKSGDPSNSLSHSVNASPEKLHRNIHEASYRAPKNGPKAFTASQHREYKQSIGSSTSVPKETGETPSGSD
jgi:hypothetical protein